MQFINTFIKTKIGAAKGLFRVIEWACDEQKWLMAILVILWTMFCIIGGMLFLPFDVVGQAIMWNVSPWWRVAMRESEEMVRDFATDW